MKRITRDTYLSDEEAENYRQIRESIEKEKPELITRHQKRVRLAGALRKSLGLGPAYSDAEILKGTKGTFWRAFVELRLALIDLGRAIWDSLRRKK